jgi:hypothetical protein
LKVFPFKAVKVEGYFVIVTALQNNTTLKSVELLLHLIHCKDDEDKQIPRSSKTNFALEHLPGIDRENRPRESAAILRLNGSGRWYQGVEVLSRLNANINCVILLVGEPETLRSKRRGDSQQEQANESDY